MIDSESARDFGNRNGDSTVNSGPIVSQWKRRPSVMSKNSSNADNIGPKPEQKNSRLDRRRSTFKGLATSIMSTLSLRRMTKGSIQPSKPLVRMENTYKMTPDEGKAVKASKIKEAISSILESHLKDETYSADRSSKLSCDLSSLIKSQIKELHFPRYKVICHVIIGQCGGQGLQVASRCVWAPSTDNFEYITYTNNSLFAVATVYGIYYE